MSSLEFSQLLSAAVNQYSHFDQAYFIDAGWDGSRFPDVVMIPELLKAVNNALQDSELLTSCKVPRAKSSNKLATEDALQ